MRCNPSASATVSGKKTVMRLQSIRLALSLVLAGSAAVHAQPAPSTPGDAMPGPRTQVLVLGTVHLAQGDAKFDPASLDGVLRRLAEFRPDIITIESMPGETCDLMRRHPAVYGPDNVTYCPDTAAGQAATGLDVPAAIASIETQLAGWPKAPTPAQRRRLAATFLAAGDPTSALVQWLQLPEAERVQGDGLDDALVQALRKRAASASEGTQIGAALAVRLGLQRVHPVDDHTGDNLRIDDMAGFERAIRGAWASAPPECAAARERDAELRAAPDLLPLYRRTNSRDYQRLPMTCDFGRALRDTSPQGFGRQYVTGWDLRNLRMVANICATFRDRPGTRVLSVVGASHKPWFDGWLGQLQGVEVVDVEEFLAGE